MKDNQFDGIQWKKYQLYAQTRPFQSFLQLKHDIEYENSNQFEKLRWNTI